nr:hypothetical protein [Paracoccaceae bacterium]
MARTGARGFGTAAGMLALLVMAAAPGAAQEGGTPVGDVGGINEGDLARILPGQAAYSPAVNRTFPTRPLFGDTHL